MKAVHWKSPKLSCKNQSVRKGQLWPWKYTGLFPSPPASMHYVWNTRMAAFQGMHVSPDVRLPRNVRQPKSVTTRQTDIPRRDRHRECDFYVLRWFKGDTIKPVCWILLKLSCRNQRSVVTLTLYPKMYRYLPVTILHLKAVLWILLVQLFQNQSVNKVQLLPWSLDPKMYRYLPITILHLCMKYESCMLKTIQVIVSEQKC